MRESPLIQVWNQSGKLVDLQIHCPNATSPQPTRFEEEIVRIFNENKQLKELLRYPYSLPMNEAGAHDENVAWIEEVEQFLKGGK